MTSKLHARTFEHKFHRLEGFTDQYDVERLLYWESFDDVHRAIAREKQLKGWRRSKDRADRIRQSALAGSGTRMVSLDDNFRGG
jgi:predicted GIY-YIG superfamily endonuclease